MSQCVGLIRELSGKRETMAGPQRLNDGGALLKDRDDEEVEAETCPIHLDLNAISRWLCKRIPQVPASSPDDDKDPLFPRLTKEQIELISRCEVLYSNDRMFPRYT